MPFWLEMDSVLIVAEAMEKLDFLGVGMAMLEESHRRGAKVCKKPEFVSGLEEVAMQQRTMVDPFLPNHNLQSKSEVP